MATKKGIYFPDEHADFLGDVTSKRVAGVIDRYREMVRRERVERLFTDAEWTILRDACQGTIFEPAPLIAGGLTAEVEDYLADDPEEVAQIDRTELLEKLSDLRYSQQVAVVEAIEAWWRERQS